LNIYSRYQIGSDLLRLHFFVSVQGDDYHTTESYLGWIELPPTAAAALELDIKWLKLHCSRTDVLRFILDVLHQSPTVAFIYKGPTQAKRSATGRTQDTAS
jgi:hypothetical protein